MNFKSIAGCHRARGVRVTEKIAKVRLTSRLMAVELRRRDANSEAAIQRAVQVGQITGWARSDAHSIECGHLGHLGLDHQQGNLNAGA